MKRKYFFILIFMMALIHFSCSDWEKDPTEIVKTEPVVEEPTGILIKTSFPKNANAFCFKDNGVFLLGTTDGFFYKSYDFGKSWTKTGEMRIKDKINFLRLASSDNLEIYVIAGTNKGGYLSTDLGSSWKEVLSAEPETGGSRVITDGDAYVFGTTNMLVISFFGFDGVYNSFYTNNTGTTWSISYRVGPIGESWQEASCYTSSPNYYYITAYNSSKASAIKNSWGNITTFKENMEINSALILKFTLGTGYVFLVGTKRGVLLSNDYGVNWKYNFLKQYKIYNLIFVDKGNQLYASTNGGLFLSFDFGITWKSVDFLENPEAITNMYLFRDYLYFTLLDGTTYYFKIPGETEQKIYSPIPEAPINNMVCEKSPLLKWVKMDEYNKIKYELQISNTYSFRSILIDTTIVDNYYQTEFQKKEVRYYWRIRSSKIWGASPWSEAWSFDLK